MRNHTSKRFAVIGLGQQNPPVRADPSMILNVDGNLQRSNHNKWTGSDLWSGYFPASKTAGPESSKRCFLFDSGEFTI